MELIEEEVMERLEETVDCMEEALERREQNIRQEAVKGKGVMFDFWSVDRDISREVILQSGIDDTSDRIGPRIGKTR